MKNINLLSKKIENILNYDIINSEACKLLNKYMAERHILISIKKTKKKKIKFKKTKKN